MVDAGQLRDALEQGRQLAGSGIRGRYAPSPTGPLHLGNLRTALLAWLQVRLQDGVLVLRMEDLDLPRCKPGSASQILEDLLWLGLDWDEGPDIGGPCGPYTQSERNTLYDAALELMGTKDLVFPCYCSRKDIQQAASAPHGKTGVYPGTCAQLSVEERRERQAEHPDRPPAIRFRVGESPDVVEFEDEVGGRVSQDLATQVGDFVVVRRDKLFAYQLAVVIDDALMGITDVVRGADLLDSTPRQIRLFETLGAPVPRFWHVPLMMDEAGRRLSKRDGSDSLESLRTQGLSAEAVIGKLANSLGFIDKPEAISAIELLNETNLETLRNLGSA